MHEVELAEYSAKIDGKNRVNFGTYGSYGIEKLHVTAGDGWENLALKATFSANGKSVSVIIPENGIVDVPQEATEKELTQGDTGTIVFSGVADGVQRISTDVRFTVDTHTPVEGVSPNPTPTDWEQYVAQVQGVVNEAIPPGGESGQVLTKTGNGNAWLPPQGFSAGSGLTLDPETNVLSVNTADTVEKDNTLPITSSAVYVTVGNIESLLGTI